MRGWQEMVFSLVEALLWIMDSYFSQKWQFEVKTPLRFLQTCRFCLLKMLIDGLERCGLLVDYCDVFISVLDSSDGTHSLQRIHWWASDGMLHYSKSDEETNTCWMAWERVDFQQFFIFRCSFWEANFIMVALANLLTQ